jgi:hypothetical protein
MAPDNAAVRDYYLLPWIDVGAAPNLRLARTTGSGWTPIASTTSTASSI